MSGALILALTALRLGSTFHNYTGDELYYEMPRFWTSTGFCPAGKIEHREITASLLSQAVRMQLRQIAALPTGSVTHVRIHWMLEMIEFVQYTQSGIPIYDFSDLDAFLTFMSEDLNLQPTIEFMANPGNVFVSNPSRNGFLWSDFSFQVTKRYLNLYGAKKILGWRFETWNEPDLKNYNKLNFSIEDYLTYTNAIRHGLNVAGRRPVNSLNFQLRGPAGLFKAENKHPLCWQILEYCNLNIKQCPFDIISYHRKGNGTDSTVLIEETKVLMQEIYERFPALKSIPISNDEADPIADWSFPRDFQADVRYAAALISIVVSHWNAKLERPELIGLESISHDNAFLSYHPYEFSQRSLMAHFRMNQTQPPHSQFVQKPVYAALGFLGKLAEYASKPQLIVDKVSEKHFWLMKTTVGETEPLYLSWLMFPEKVDIQENTDFEYEYSLPYSLCEDETYAFIVEVLEQINTNPVNVWKNHGSPPYPDATLREHMRRSQTPRILHAAELIKPEIRIQLKNVVSPWILLLRVCSNLIEILKQPQHLSVDSVTKNEVFITWRETLPTKCLDSYEVWFRTNETVAWQYISQGWHLPFPSFHFAPINDAVNGFYKIRGVDIFQRYSSFSDVVEYVEI